MKKNINMDEITKFERLAKQWWNLKGKLKLLHYLNETRLDYILNCSNGLFKKKVLDIGCGGGILSESMSNEGANVTGLDINKKLIEIAKLHSIKQGKKIEYFQETVEEHLKRFSFHYDIITCMEVLEHVPHPSSIVFACSRLVKPGGIVFFSTINRNLKSWIFAIFLAENVFRLLPEGIHNFKRFIKPSELLSWIDETSLVEKEIVGIKYSFFRKKFLLTKNIDVNYLIYVKSYKNYIG